LIYLFLSFTDPYPEILRFLFRNQE